jgi:hypothetical protein
LIKFAKQINSVIFGKQNQIKMQQVYLSFNHYTGVKAYAMHRQSSKALFVATENGHLYIHSVERSLLKSLNGYKEIQENEYEQFRDAATRSSKQEFYNNLKYKGD